jgi:hypothetical protein
MAFQIQFQESLTAIEDGRAVALVLYSHHDTETSMSRNITSLFGVAAFLYRSAA